VFSLGGSLLSMTGGLVLLSREDLAEKMSRLAAPFAAGALLGTAFLDLLPEAAHEGGEHIFQWVLGGMIVFFLLERFVLEFHHQHTHSQHPEEAPEMQDAAVPLIVLGDAVHNFIDGVIIAGTFLVSIPLGVVTTFAVAAHEIPQEIGDFGLLLHRGVSKKRVLMYNLLGGLATVVAALMTYFVGARIVEILPVFLGLTAGFFIYIAASDLIPEIHRKRVKDASGAMDTLLLFVGIGVVWLTVTQLH
jgi:zinc and cadmium transporter